LSCKGRDPSLVINLPNKAPAGPPATPPAMSACFKASKAATLAVAFPVLIFILLIKVKKTYFFLLKIKRDCFCCLLKAILLKIKN
jgi:hypothetical protein